MLVGLPPPGGGPLCAARPAHPASRVADGRVAITVDDLPVFPELPPGNQAVAITRRLLAGFARYRWPVTGFVNEGQLEGHRRAGLAVLRAWVRSGHELGNHTYSHASLSITPARDYITDIARGDRLTRPLLAAFGKRETWFRYPYLATGRTWKDRVRVEAWLHAHRYRVAPVSLVNSDWMFAEPYDAAMKRRDRAAAERIRNAYIDYTAQMIEWTRRATLALLNREPAYILLIHASRLNADTIDALANIVTAGKLRPVPLAVAAADPAYRIRETYVGMDGPPSLERWGMAMGRPISKAGQPRIPPAIIADYDRIEAIDPDTRSPLPSAHDR